MATPVVQSSASNTDQASTNVVVTAPTGITTGDFLVAYFSSFDTSDHTHTTPSGWTKQEGVNGGTDGEFSIFYKVAVLADESATDYTFTASITCDLLVAGILRIDGVASGQEVRSSDAVLDANGGTSISETVSAATGANDQLVIVGAVGIDLNATSLSVSGYTTTPSMSFTEVIDVSTINGSNNGIVLGVATAPYSTSNTITTAGATFSENVDRASYISVFVVNAPQNETGTSALLEVSPTFFAGTASAGTSGTSDLLEVSPTFPTSNGTANAPTQWTNEAEVNTTWTNEQTL